MVPLRVSILGVGPAGLALAADLARHGTEVLLYSHPDHTRHANQVLARGHLVVTGVFECAVDVRITTDMAAAVAFSHILVLAVPSCAQATLLPLLRRLDLGRHTILAVPGNLFSLLLVDGAGLDVANVLETNLSPYSCRMDPSPSEPGRVVVFGKKRRLLVAALRPELVDRAAVAALLPRVDLRWCAGGVVEVCLSNVNGTFHPLMVLLNAGRIEDTAGDFLAYRDGLTRSVANAMEAVDAVRLAVGAALGMRLGTSLHISNECYGQDFGDLVDLARLSPPHNRLRAPAGVCGRNVTEDVADLLVAWRELAVVVGVDAAPIDAVVVLAGMATGVDYMSTGRTLAKLGLAGVSREELLTRFAVPTEVSAGREKQVGTTAALQVEAKAHL